MASGLRSKRAPSHRTLLNLAHLSLERLEDWRLLAIVNWTGLGDGINWSNSHNWSGNALPDSR